jgi:hypothetical protein
MKFTVILEEGKVVAAQQSSGVEYGRGAGLEVGPGQSTQEVDLPDEAFDITQPEQFEREIARSLTQE